MYDLSLLPESYQRVNTIERVQFTFQTNGPDGLIWFSGNARDNLQLSLRVRWRWTLSRDRFACSELRAWSKDFGGGG